MEILVSFIIPFIILLTVVVFIHEYGHYYFARKYGVGITDFSIGFGKELFGFNDKSGTRWKFCAIPLGGYVKFFGDRNVFSQAEQNELLKKYSKEDQQKLFVTKPLYQRSLIVLAGPLANFVLAIFIRCSKLPLLVEKPLALTHSFDGGKNPRPAMCRNFVSLYPLVPHSGHLFGLAKGVPSFLVLCILPLPLHI